LREGAFHYSEGFASHRGVDGIEDLQTVGGSYTLRDDRIADGQHVALCAGECGPPGKAWAVRISGLRKVDPIARHLVGHLMIGGGPAPGLLIEVVEDIPELGVVARSPVCVDGIGWERRLLPEGIVEDAASAGAGLQPRPGPHVPCKAEVTFEVESRLLCFCVGGVRIGRGERRGQGSIAAGEIAVEGCGGEMADIHQRARLVDVRADQKGHIVLLRGGEGFIG